MKKTKIVATIGPASEKVVILKKLIMAGMDVCRLNFSHGTHAGHQTLIQNIREAGRLAKSPVFILQDLQGPRLRLGELPPQGVELRVGDDVILKPESLFKAHVFSRVLPIQYGKLAHEIKKGQMIFLKDGMVSLKVRKIDDLSLRCEVVAGGLVKRFQGMNFPGAKLKIPVLGMKDKQDILFGIKNKVDWICLSFVKDGHDILELKEFVHHSGGSQGIVAKIERWEALENLDGILRHADAVMIGRGDLGVELPPEKVPLLQKKIIDECLAWAKPVIVATQMLESMISSPRPTRAEASDVANAVIDQADATMLSGETAFGKYPILAVDIMRRIIEEVEASSLDERAREYPVMKGKYSQVSEIARAVAKMARDSKLNLIIALAADPIEVQLISRHRAEVKILVMTDEPHLQKKLSLTFGSYTEVVDPEYSLDNLLKKALNIARKRKMVKDGDKALIVAGQKVKDRHEMCVVSMITV